MRYGNSPRWMQRLREWWPVGAPFDLILIYIRAWYRLGYRPRLRNPRTYNELLLANMRCFRGDIALARRVVDKVEFKAWLHETPEWRHLIVPTLEVYDSVQEMEGRVFQPDTIIKPAHLSGRVLMFDRARTLTRDEKNKMGNWLALDYYQSSREPPYKGMKKRLLLEPLLREEDGKPIKDFKIYMINAQPLMIQLDFDRFVRHRNQFYSPNWDLLDFAWGGERNLEPIPRPAQLEAILDLAVQLSRPFPVCRVDLYLLPDGAIKAGEVTFYSGGGSDWFTPQEADWELGCRARELLEREPARV